MSTWSPQDAMDASINFAADAVSHFNRRIAELEDLEARRKYIATWKAEAKAAIRKLSATANETYTKYRNFVKNYDTTHLGSPINAKAIHDLLEILTEARGKQENEKRKGQYAITKLFKDIGWYIGISNTEFGDIKNAINMCFLGLQSEYQDFQEFAHKTLADMQRNPDIKTADQAIESLKKLNRDLSTKKGEISSNMRNYIQELQNCVRKYTTKKMNEMQYKFDEIKKKVETETANKAKSSSAAALTPENVSDLTTSEFIAAIPNTLIFFKILASIAGVRSNSVHVVNPGENKKYGKYGYGLFAKICFTIERYMEGLTEEFNKKLDTIQRQITASDAAGPITASDAIKTLTWR